MPVAVIGQQTPFVRQGQDLFLGGENFTGGTVRYHKYLDTTTTDTDKKNVIKDAIDSPPSVNWASVGTNITTSVLSDNLIRVQTPSIEGGSNSWVAPFIVRNASGDSSTGVINKPVLFGIAGTDPARVYAGDILTIVGSCLASPNKDTTVWLWDGVEPVNTSGLYRCTVLDQRGASNTGSQDQHALSSAIDFIVPSGLSAANYYVLVFTSENEWGLTVKNALQVTLVSGSDPWSNPTYDDALLTSTPFSDITQALMARLFADDGLASASSPYVVRLPPGTFYLSHVIPWPANMGLQGSGQGATTLAPNPALSSLGNAAGQFYYNLATYSTDNGGVYGANVTGVYSGDQRVVTIPAMFRIRGANTRFCGLTLSATLDGKRETVQACLGAAAINDCHCENVAFDNPLISDSTSTCGVRRFGLWKYWRFTNCLFNANRSMTAEASVVAAYSTNGSLDNSVIEECHFTGPNGVRANSRGINFGRCCVLRNLHFEGLRRCIVTNGSFYPLESAIIDCQFDHTGTERGQSEVILTEGMESEYLAVASATASTFVVSGDTTNRTRWVAYVVSGKGRYQARVIASSSSGTHTLESNWAITPDATSVICCFPAMMNCAIAGGEFQDTIGGINLYGMAIGVQMRQNRMVSSSEGILFYGYDTASGRYSAQGWHSLTHNSFYQGSGLILIAIRSSASAALRTFPLIECVSATRTSCHGGMQCELAAGIGDSATSTIDWTDANLDSAPLIDCISFRVDDYYATNTKYLHPVRTMVPLPTVPWILSQKGIANFNLESVDVNDVSVPNTAALIMRSNQLHQTRFSLTDIIENTVLRSGVIRKPVR